MKIDPERLQLTVAAALGVAKDAVALERKLDEIAELDSLSLIEIATAIDDDLEIRLAAETLHEGLTVSELVELAERAPRR